MKTLFRKNSFDIGRWSIWQEENTIKFGHSATLQGSLIIRKEVVYEGKAGRSLQEQIESRINSRISKMRDKGYKDSHDEAAKAVTNQLGLITPMLAKPLKAKRINPSIIQPKLNGHRCLITCVDGDIVAYSRQGKLICTIKHITREFEDLLPEGATIDGELYIHGEKLQKIASLVKRYQDRTSEIKYYAYDYIVPGEQSLAFTDRLQILESLLENTGDTVELTESTYVQYIMDAFQHYNRHVDEGFEGSILRDCKGKYESGKRSAGLLKMKPLFDTEVQVVDIVKGRTGLGICVCRLEGLDRTFNVLAPGDNPTKIETLENKDDYIGRRLKIEYRELTADGVPFHAVATEWFTVI